MDYFKNLPMVSYDFTTTEESKQVFVLNDLLIRTNLLINAEGVDEFLKQYYIKDFETPLSVSYELYGTSDYYWSVMFINNMYDMYSDWPLSAEEIENYAKRIYPGVSKSMISDDKYLVKVAPYGGNASQITIKREALYNTTPLYPQNIMVGSFLPFSICNSDTAYITGITLSDTEIVATLSELTVTPQAEETVAYFYHPIETYLNIRHYESSLGVVKDFDILVEMNEPTISVSNLEYLIGENENKRRINVIDPKYIQEFISVYRKGFLK